MEYKNDELSARFTVPDKLTVRQQLQYYSTVAFSDKKDMVERSFEGAKLLIDEWHCDLLPSLDDSLDEVTNPLVADVILWATRKVREHVSQLRELPKNS